MAQKERECILMWDDMSIKSWLDYNPKKDLKVTLIWESMVAIKITVIIF